MEPEARDIRDEEEEEPDTQRQLGVELARLVEYELAGDSTQEREQGG